MQNLQVPSSENRARTTKQPAFSKTRGETSGVKLLIENDKNLIFLKL